MTKSFFITDPFSSKHYNIWDNTHIETPDRVSAILEGLQETKLHDKVIHLDPVEANLEDIYLNHPESFVREFEKICETNEEKMKEYCQDHEDIYINKYSYKAAIRSTGCCLKLMDVVLKNPGSNGFAAVRPPGHHAYGDYPNGFCFFNNAIICAKKANKIGVEKVLVIDWDVHAGQGSQFSIENSSGIKLINIHRYENGKFWPYHKENGLSSLKESSNVINIPLNKIGFGDGEYYAIFHKIIFPFILDYQPNLIIVSCGFDASIGDPEGQMKISPHGYGLFTRLLSSTSIPLCVFLEGGYFIDSVKECSVEVIRGLLIKQPFQYVSGELFKDEDPNFNSYLYGIMNNSDNLLMKSILLHLEYLFTQNGKQLSTEINLNDYDSIRNVPKPYPIENLYPPYDEETKKKFKNELYNSMISGKYKYDTNFVDIHFYHNKISLSNSNKNKITISISSYQQCVFIICCLILPNIWKIRIVNDEINLYKWIESFEKMPIVINNQQFFDHMKELEEYFKLKIC
uniref:Hist_deacetyl domain-containing protein n=1 Tax=Parastrongyloides trichosuri TaxID=131310 RepID=A0A0N4ZN46_PARTI